MTSPVLIRMKHIRAAHMCSSGARSWFGRHGFDWAKFLKNGIEVEKFEATGDPMALKVAELARHGR